MGLFDTLIKKRKYRNPDSEALEPTYEFCPRCEANLTLQKGYSNSLPFWNCKGCGEMLINPKVDAKEDIAWICDGCGNMLNIQDGFKENCGNWKCTECGFINKIDEAEMYLSEDEYQTSLQNPYKGLSNAEVLALSDYEEVGFINGRSDIIMVKSLENGQFYVKKYLKEYDLSVYQYLKEHPIAHMPRLIAIYEGSNNLVVIEEYVEGKTLSEILRDGDLPQDKAIKIAISVCKILKELHGGEKAIIHRDIKPSNIIISDEETVYLLDINVAKWYKPEEAEDTKLYGTLYYAAPEQFGYGFSASSEKSDIYAVGMILNVMITGKMPKEEKAAGPVWDIIEKCISLEPKMRYTAEELIAALERV
ncbi:MAG: protein kinase [Lachnospiraceae bacterium]